MHKPIACALLLLASPAASQQAGEVSGTVYDSVSQAPLRGAIVQMVSAAGTPMLSAATDARGRYTISAAPAGRYAIEFTHSVLDSLAIEPPQREVVVRGAETARMDLAVPAPETIVTTICRTTPADSVGLLFGILHDSRSRAGVDSGQVIARWSELVISQGSLRNHERFAASATSREGWFAMCGIPTNIEVQVLAARGADSSGISQVAMPPHGLIRFDVAIGGVASVRGRVTSGGRPVDNARVRAGTDERSTYTDSAGEYRLAAVPAGTQTIEVRALGYAPQQASRTLAPDQESRIDVELTSVQRVMDTIRVVAERVYSIDAVGFERRRKVGQGLYFDTDAVRRRSPFSVLQLLLETPTIQVQQADTSLERKLVMRGGDGESMRACPPAFYVNGVRMPSEMVRELDLIVRPQDLQGMEVYRGGVTMPPEFFVRGACGAVVVWSKRPLPRRR